MARWCSICGATDKPIGVLSVSFKITNAKDRLNSVATTAGGSRYMCEQCSDKIFKMSVDAPSAPNPKADGQQ